MTDNSSIRIQIPLRKSHKVESQLNTLLKSVEKTYGDPALLADSEPQWHGLQAETQGGSRLITIDITSLKSGADLTRQAVGSIIAENGGEIIKEVPAPDYSRYR